MTDRKCPALVWCLLAAGCVGGATAAQEVAAGGGRVQGDTETPARPLRVGTREVPPFAMRTADGSWTGISVELWSAIADELGYEYVFEEEDLEEMLDSVRSGELDAVVAAFTVTVQREAGIDFSHPYFTSGLGIAVSGEEAGPWSRILRRVAVREFLGVTGSLALLLFLVGMLVWLLERKGNRDEFGGKQGLWSGFWWSAVTMTTVGYGDKTPRTVGGRVVALFWMFASIILISSFTAGIASSLTVSGLSGQVRGREDLDEVRVATVAGSTAQQYLDDHKISAREYATPLEALEALRRGGTSAVVYDEPVLRNLAQADRAGAGGVRVLKRTFEPQNYAIALPEGSERREDVNRALLRFVATAQWDELLEEYLGDD